MKTLTEKLIASRQLIDDPLYWANYWPTMRKRHWGFHCSITAIQEVTMGEDYLEGLHLLGEVAAKSFHGSIGNWNDNSTHSEVINGWNAAILTAAYMGL